MKDYADQDLGYEEKDVPAWIGAGFAVATAVLWALAGYGAYILILKEMAR